MFDRTDPYYANLWPTGSGGLAVSWDAVEMHHRIPQEEVEQARLGILSARRRRRLVALAAIGMWKTATTEQLIAITGDPSIAANDLSTLHLGGLAMRGKFVQSMRDGTLPELWRPFPPAKIKTFSEHLSYNEWLAVTLGRNWRGTGTFDRHNILTTELSLRVAEATDIAACFGEALAGWPLLLPGFANSPKSGDAVWVRHDGLRIVVETMGSSSLPHLQQKAEAWAGVLSRNTSSDLFVLWLDARPHHSPRNAAPFRAVASAAHASIATALAKVPSRMGLVAWQDWFPAPGEVDEEAFLSLRVQRPTGRDGDKVAWEPVSLLDPFELPCSSERARDVLDNLGVIWGTPAWQREPHPEPDFRPMLRQRALGS